MDLAQAINWIAADNPAAADRFAAELVERTNLLENAPRLGAVYQRRRGNETRQFTFRRYRVLYRVRPRLNVVQILKKWHGARREPKLR
jgi:plasmid stabilization system protein ParE